MYICSKNKKINISFIRHASTLFDEENKIKGINDVEISKKGYEEIKKLKLINKFDIYYHSPLKRTKHTLYELLLNNKENIEELNIKEDILITNRKFGILEGLTKKEIEIKYPELNNKWKYNENIIEEGIENIENIIDRIKLFLSKILSYDNCFNILVITDSEFLYALYKFINNIDLNIKNDNLEINFDIFCKVDLKIEIINSEVLLNLFIENKKYLKKINF